MRELGASRSNDTLGRWLSHHVAELMNAVDGAKSPDEKAQKLIEATDLILRIWLRRNALPGEANPLARFREAITVLLKYEDPYSHFSNIQIPATHSLAHKISSDSRRLELFVKLVGAGTGEKAEEPIDQAALEALSVDELDAIQKLTLFFQDTPLPKGANAGTRGELTKATLQELLSGMINDLKQLQTLLRERAGVKARSRRRKKSNR